MAPQMTQLEGLQRKLDITVPADQLTNIYQKKLAAFAKNAKLKGFRPGKVPVTIIEQKFGRGLLQESAAQLIESSLQSTLNEEKIRPAGMPGIEFDYKQLKQGDSFQYAAKFEIYPEFQLKDLTGVGIEVVSAELGDADVNASLIKLRTQHAEWTVVDRTAKLGDRVKIDFDGTIEGEALEHGSAKGQSLELGSKSMIPGFEDGIIGMKKGESKTIQISFPAEYHVEKLRAKPVAFIVTLHDIEEPKLAVLDDNFAEKLGFKEGLDALKNKIKENMQAQLKDALTAKLKQTVLDKLAELNPILVPGALIEAEIAHLQDITRNQMHQYMGNDKKINVDKFPLSREPYEAEAKKRVLLGLLLAEVIKQHALTIDQTKVQNRLTEMASNYPKPSEIIEIFTKNKQMMSNIEAQVLEEQAVDTLLKNARVTDVKKSYDAIVNGQ